jgi:hypothetical protein
MHWKTGAVPDPDLRFAFGEPRIFRAKSRRLFSVNYAPFPAKNFADAGRGFSLPFAVQGLTPRPADLQLRRDTRKHGFRP